jgi:DNA-binding transcriptional LysR family regulator
MGMDPHLLRTYVTVARLASFSGAARELGYTQSAVSQHIAALEHDLGLPLLGRRPVAPTPAGERLLEHAGPLLLRLDAARADVMRFTGAPGEALTVAVSPLAAHRVPSPPCPRRASRCGPCPATRCPWPSRPARPTSASWTDWPPPVTP